MPTVDLDDLLEGGAELGRGVVMKAQLRFRVHPPRHRAAQDVVDRAVSAYDERLGLILEEVSGLLAQADRRVTSDQPLVVAVSKAIAHAPFRPGSRGGKWYRDSRGNVRYGDPPEGKFMGNAGADPPAPPVEHLRPRPFMGSFGNDQDLTDYLAEHGGAHGFSDGELRFLGAWYGNGEDGGALFDAFLECAGLTRDELEGGTAHLRFGGQKLTFEEAVFEFFAAQGALFMGEEPTSPEQVEEWHRVLNDDIKPLLDGVFVKYEDLKEDEAFQEKFAGAADRQRRRFFAAARRNDDAELRAVADSVVGDWDPDRQVGAVLSGMRSLGLFLRPAKAERHAYLHGRPHLRDAVVLDGRLLGDDPGNPLLKDREKLAELPASHLMLLYAAAELHRRWDPHAKSFSTEKQADAGSGDLGEAALEAISKKNDQWAEASGMVRGHLEELVDRLVTKLNKINSREGMPTKHGPTKKPRSR